MTTREILFKSTERPKTIEFSTSPERGRFDVPTAVILDPEAIKRKYSEPTITERSVIDREAPFKSSQLELTEEAVAEADKVSDYPYFLEKKPSVKPDFKSGPEIIDLDPEIKKLRKPSRFSGRLRRVLGQVVPTSISASGAKTSKDLIDLIRSERTRRVAKSTAKGLGRVSKKTAIVGGKTLAKTAKVSTGATALTGKRLEERFLARPGAQKPIFRPLSNLERRLVGLPTGIELTREDLLAISFGEVPETLLKLRVKKATQLINEIRKINNTIDSLPENDSRIGILLSRKEALERQLAPLSSATVQALPRELKTASFRQLLPQPPRQQTQQARQFIPVGTSSGGTIEVRERRKPGRPRKRRPENSGIMPVIDLSR